MHTVPNQGVPGVFGTGPGNSFQMENTMFVKSWDKFDIAASKEGAAILSALNPKRPQHRALAKRKVVRGSKGANSRKPLIRCP